MRFNDLPEYNVALSYRQLDLLMRILGCAETNDIDSGRDASEIAALAKHIEEQTAD